MASNPRPARRIIRFDNGRPNLSAIPFDYLDPDLPALRLLREQEGLDRLAAGATTEMELIRLVLDRVKRQWDHSFHFPMQHINALEVLEDVRSGLRGNFCVYFTHVLLQALWSLGIPCRYLYIAVHHRQSHATSECWSNEHRKWIIVDSDFSLYYVRPDLAEPDMGPVRGFIPQNALDIQRAFHEGRMAEILVAQNPWGAALNYATRLGEFYGSQFGFLADYQSALTGGPPEWAGRSGQWYLWEAPDDPEAAVHRNEFELVFGNCDCRWIGNQADYYWPLNEVVIEPPDSDSLQRDAARIRFETFTPFFAEFQIRVNGGSWQCRPAERATGHAAHGSFDWPLGSGRNTLEIRARNRAGRLGPIARIEAAAPPYVPPEPVGRWDGGEKGGGLGAFAAHGGALYVPMKNAGRIEIVSPGGAIRALGSPPPAATPTEGPPAEPWSEPLAIARGKTAPPGFLLAPQACAVTPDGAVFVADAEHYRIQPFAPDGTPRAPWGSHGTGDDQFLHLRALAVAQDGSVIAADSGYVGPVGMRTDHVSRLRRFSPTGAVLKQLAVSGAAPGAVCSPAGLAVDAAGNIWVADSGNHRVQCFTPDGRLLACWGVCGDEWGGLRYPTGVAAAEDGAIFVADPQHRCVWKFSAAGEPLARIERCGECLFLRPGRLAAEGSFLFIGDVGTGCVYTMRI
jgi:sugar lactone lactonase YvrE